MKRLLLLLLTLAFAGPAWAERGALSLSRNIDQLTSRSAVILRGTVLSAHVEKHPVLTGLDTVVVRMRVRETLKGRPGATYTFRQYIWDIRDRFDAAGYRKGQDYLLMMIAPSDYGLSSPAGLAQGRFRILRDRTGKELAVNGHANLRLFDGVSAQLAKEGISLSPKSSKLLASHHVGLVDLRELTDLVRELAQRNP